MPEKIGEHQHYSYDEKGNYVFVWFEASDDNSYDNVKHYFSYNDKNGIFSAVNAPLWFLQRMWLDLEAKYNLYFI